MAYDSRSDHPRLRHGHTYCRGAWSAPAEPLTEAEAIAEGLTELEEDTGD